MDPKFTPCSALQDINQAFLDTLQAELGLVRPEFYHAAVALYRHNVHKALSTVQQQWFKHADDFDFNKEG